MDEPASAPKDPQLAEMQQAQAIRAAQAQMGSAMAKEKADEADMREQYGQQGYVNPAYNTTGDPVLAASVAVSTLEIAPRKKWAKKSDKVLIYLTALVAVGVITALAFLFIAK